MKTRDYSIKIENNTCYDGLMTEKTTTTTLFFPIIQFAFQKTSIKYQRTPDQLKNVDTLNFKFVCMSNCSKSDIFKEKKTGLSVG